MKKSVSVLLCFLNCLSFQSALLINIDLNVPRTSVNEEFVSVGIGRTWTMFNFRYTIFIHSILEEPYCLKI